MNELTNKKRNEEVENMLKGLKDLGLGAQVEAHTSHANALASLNVAESLQLLQLQLAESSTDNKKALHDTTDKLIKSNILLAKSNDRHATAMQRLTFALIIIGALQALIMWKIH